MKNFTEDKAFANRAEIAPGSKPAQNHCEKCYEPLVFSLLGREGPFSIGLMTVLECLKAAEGAVPKLPSEWWMTIQQRYRDLKFN